MIKWNNETRCYEDTERYHIAKPSSRIKTLFYAGNYVILGELIFSFYKKPNWFHRVMTRLLLGWVWHDTINKEAE